MSDDQLADRVRAFDRILGIPPDAPWFYPPMTNDLILASEQALGHRIPDDLLELYRVHNGGQIFDYFDWVPISDRNESRYSLDHFDLDWFVTEEVAEHAAFMPGPRTLGVASAPHRMILYDMDEQPGRLLYLEIVADNTLVPLCRSLRAFAEYHLALAHGGYSYLAEAGPRFGIGPRQFGEWSDVFVGRLVTRCLEHGVNPAYHLGTDVWLEHPEAADFSVS